MNNQINTPGTVIQIASKVDFEISVLRASCPVIVDFWATWCGPCRMFLPTLEEFAKTYTNVKVYKINVDDCPEIAADYGIQSIPTTLLFESGSCVGKHTGVMSLAQLTTFIRENLKEPF